MHAAYIQGFLKHYNIFVESDQLIVKVADFVDRGEFLQAAILVNDFDLSDRAD
jgi:hypothetical protein